mmetsp:Transcript_929/g.1983  ORF Transcript_929/g.1983 Transcript_929/m.1983 type:complete len:380 (+) Transcript_929:256-1395(+)
MAPYKATADYGSDIRNSRADESTLLIHHEGLEMEGSDSDGARYEESTNSWDHSEYCCSWKQYFSSWRFIELTFCVVPFLLVGTYFELGEVVPRTRPMPFQHVEQIPTTHDGGSIGGTSTATFPEGTDGVYESYTGIVWNLVNSEKLLGETVGHYEYMILMGSCPWLLQLFLAWFVAPAKQRANNLYRWDVLHRTTCVYFAGIGLTDLVTNCIKYYVGYLRPIFLDICQPHYDEEHAMFRCMDEHDPHTLDARVSFPSNHSAWSFCGMLLLSMYLERRFGLSSISNSGNDCDMTTGPSNITDRRTKTSPRYKNRKEQQWQRQDRQSLYRLVSLICYSPMLFATFVAASRVVDNKHFPADVVCGAMLGGSIASLVFGIWFP